MKEKEELSVFKSYLRALLQDLKDINCLIVAVAHREFKTMTMDRIKSLFGDVPDDEKVLIDVKGLYSIQELKASGMQWWRL